MEGAPQAVAAEANDDDNGEEVPQTRASSSGSLAVQSGMNEAWQKLFVKRE